MKITSRPYGKLPGGEAVTEYTLENNLGLSVSVLDYNGAVTSLLVPDKNGETVDIVLAHKDINGYVNSPGYFGALVGRNANRIRNSVLQIGEESYKLTPNDGANHLHGGKNGITGRLFTAEVMTTSSQPVLLLSTKINDMEDELPGNITINVTYALTNDNSLVIAYRGVSDKDTIINLTNHSYFNMAGHSSGQVLNQTLELASGFYTPGAADCIPNGEVCSVEGTPFDFRAAKPIGQDIAADHEQIKMFGGFDHSFMLDGSGYRRVAEMSDPVGGRVMTVFTDLPCVQLYSANKLPFEGFESKDGASYVNHQGICLETQTTPNAAQMPWLKSPIYAAGQEYASTTAFKFSAR